MACIELAANLACCNGAMVQRSFSFSFCLSARHYLRFSLSFSARHHWNRMAAKCQIALMCVAK
jgi:hypothetical protein